MKTKQVSIDYDLAGVTYDITGSFSRHFTMPCFDGPYDDEWTLDELEIYSDYEFIDEALLSDIYLKKGDRFITVLSDIEQRLHEKC